MKLVVLTIVKNGMPWITLHYPTLRKLAIPWTWMVVEGTAAPEHCTSWCRKVEPGLSTDGTSEYLDSIVALDERVCLFRSEMWHGKVQMVNTPLARIQEPCVLVQVDADEIWTQIQLERIYNVMQRDKWNVGYFYCRYFLGPDIIINSRDTFGNRTEFEWCRAWRFFPGQRFISHEPPRLDGMEPVVMTHRYTERHALIFDHMAYATERQIIEKVNYYGSPNNKIGHLYSDGVEGWRRLQDNTHWPVKVRDFLRFVKDDATAIRITEYDKLRDCYGLGNRKIHRRGE